MDREERLVERFLDSEGHADVRFEPDGNVPPDFAVGESVGVEVRRLNQNYTAPNGTTRGLEEDDIPLVMTVRKVLAAAGPPRDGQSCWVNYTFTRPLAPLSTVASELKDWLNQLEMPRDDHVETRLPSGLKVWAFPAGSTLSNRFALGITSDWDSGGWVLSELHRNLEICVTEKTQKTAPYLDRYSEWWLALVDYIGYGLSEPDRDEFGTHTGVTKPWTRIIIINPLAPGRSFDLSSARSLPPAPSLLDQA